jgi:hypothetical protein
MLDFQQIIIQANLSSVEDLYGHFYNPGWNDWVDEYQNDSFGYLGDVTCQGFGGFQFVLDWTESSSSHEYPCCNLPETRVIVSYGISKEKKADLTDRKIMKQYLGNSGKIYAHFGPKYNKGHFIAASMGGAIDINLFPQVEHINLGRSAEGKRYREMERYVTSHPGTFVFSRPVYKDFSVCPFTIEYGYCDNNMRFVTETFTNKD